MRDLQNAGSLGKIIVQLFHFCFEFWETGDSGRVDPAGRKHYR